MKILILICFMMSSFLALGSDVYSVKKVSADLTKITHASDEYWKGIPEAKIELTGQMVVKPMTAKVQTETVKVQIIHNGNYIAFRLRWADKEKSEAGKLATFSDAVALEFPVKDNLNPPPVYMGEKDNPVHLFHWRAQYQYDEEHGKKDIKDIYPNKSTDIYPNEFPDRGNLKPATREQQEMFAHGVAAGNPQSSRKAAVDELMAEGFGSSAAREDRDSVGQGEWEDGEWTVVISRALKRKNGSILEVGKNSSYGVAVWQGGKDEVGSRKSLTMDWIPFKIEEK